jgi:hypothetical protein
MSSDGSDPRVRIGDERALKKRPATRGPVMRGLRRNPCGTSMREAVADLLVPTFECLGVVRLASFIGFEHLCG